LLALPVVRSARRQILVLGATRGDRAETLASLRDTFLIGGPLALLLTSLAGYALAGAALRPIEAMRRRAAEISSSSLDERLPVPEADDEVSRLGETLNEMLGRLEDGVLGERRFHRRREPRAGHAAHAPQDRAGARARAGGRARRRGAAVRPRRRGRVPSGLRGAGVRAIQPRRRPGGDGSGLGPAIVDTIARAHGGRARVANRPRGGAEVSLELPLA
jgi:signal transduction histidine kinase